MTSTDLLADAFDRVRDAVHPAVNGLSADELAFRPDEESNSIAWLVWHLTRIQDDHVSGLDGKEQVWTARGWADRFALPLDVADTGYGHDPEKVAVVTADAALLLGYYEDVHRKTLEFVRSLEESDLARVVDRRWDPPVTMSVRLVSVIADDLQHVGQAAYARGILQRR
ncbi:MAG: mycothiol transferase [Acidimicrobiales bacterium]